MKRVRCPKCDYYLSFDETKYEIGQSIVFQCPACGKQFGIRISQPKQQAEEEIKDCGRITVIENVFHYKQELPLRMGDNQIGRYQKGNPINTPIETADPSVDLLHCTITVSRNKKGKLIYTLKDGPSYTGTFVDNVILGDRERRIIEDGQLFTIGATSIILHAAGSTEE